MKKILIVGVVTGIVTYAFFSSLTRQMSRRLSGAGTSGELPDENRSEGYFYHQVDQTPAVDAGSLARNINN